MILVTGATGLVGSHLLFQLLKSDVPIRATYRRKETLQHVKHVFAYFSNHPNTLFNRIDWVEADINNIPQLQDAFKGVQWVYHCAALVSFDPHRYKLLRTVNIKGTANIVNLCLSHDVKKLCYVSSIAALGHYNRPEKHIHEQTEWNPEDDNTVYAITKYGAELEVWRGTQEGLDAVIVNPGIILGGGYWHGAGSGSLFKRLYEGQSFYTAGVTGYVGIWDVVKVMEMLMQSHIKNEGFILVSENLSFKTFFTKVAKALKVKPPYKEAKSWLLQLAWRLDWLKHAILRQPRILSKQAAKSAQSLTYYDNSKLKSALDFEFTPIDESIETVSTLFIKDRFST
ncbi:NAD-dependent epimerase/dehydratase family protein [Winogradskyella arenosi]|uniref:Nucleoside-diphosphate-sugar epimerase n=1 Tax=Winogradskyella arenosi TaxID=533325 RepID=A0A368ZJF7_9FLAO|nr:NAD-dependent epimerase/dehydratase family protein [Winogradskyella arenosi]RCW93881.1 nucleoside-diphosphate-sugar epimerase [Winogradskyella arenosi]